MGRCIQRLLNSHHCHPIRVDLLDPGGVIADGGHDDALHLLLQKRQELLFLIFRIPVGIAQQDIIPAVNQRIVDARDQIRVIKIGNIGDDHSHFIGAVGFEIPSQHIGLVVQLPHRCLHPKAQFIADRVIRVVYNAGHRRDRYTAVLSHIVNRNFLFGHCLAPSLPANDGFRLVPSGAGRLVSEFFLLFPKFVSAKITVNDC